MPSVAAPGGVAAAPCTAATATLAASAELRQENATVFRQSCLAGFMKLWQIFAGNHEHHDLSRSMPVLRFYTPPPPQSALALA